MFCFEMMLGIFGFVYLEQYSWTEAYYMTVITLSTVGFTEVQPLSSQGQLFASGLILLNIGIFAYILSAITSFVVKGEIFKKMHVNVIAKRIGELDNHIIICGYGRYGKEIAEQFLLHNMNFVVIEKDHEKIVEIQRSPEKILYIEEDATKDEALLNAGIERARALISTLSDDINNVYTVLSARQLNSNINIISRAASPQAGQKLELAGCSQVIMPDQIGAFYMATLISKPGTVEFFSQVTNEFEADIGFEEIRYDQVKPQNQNKSIKELNIRKSTGANIIGYKQRQGLYIINPQPEVILEEGTSFIVLGSVEQLDKLRRQLFP
ncbi:MAG: potassium channel protein [Bacteroidota bacterium]